MGGSNGTPSGGEGSGLGVRRRSVIAGIAGAAASSAGCVHRVRSSPEPVSLEIKAVPADVDRRAVYIARPVADNLQSVGVDAR